MAHPLAGVTNAIRKVRTVARLFPFVLQGLQSEYSFHALDAQSELGCNMPAVVVHGIGHVHREHGITQAIGEWRRRLE